ncbi:MAG TPA: hypothetical protein VFS39_17455, partial [Nitrospira sp.]|nr:hypothetical protein [Nitrospira sp.]
PAGTHLLLDASSIERFLEALDGQPPDWQVVYGAGHHDPEHDDRVFALNRERDAQRDGKPALSWLVTFTWAGEIGAYRQEEQGFPVALGPVFTPTAWGIVRFKPEEVPGNLVVAAEDSRLERVEILVLMTGRLIPQESIVYDFSHEEEGRGLIMPLVRVEFVQFVRLDSQ